MTEHRLEEPKNTPSYYHLLLKSHGILPSHTLVSYGQTDLGKWTRPLNLSSQHSASLRTFLTADAHLVMAIQLNKSRENVLQSHNTFSDEELRSNLIKFDSITGPLTNEWRAEISITILPRNYPSYYHSSLQKCCAKYTTLISKHLSR